MAFYGDMADMVRDLLKPDDAGGLGQTGLVLVNEIPPPASEPSWAEQPAGTKQTEILLGAARGVAKELIGARGIGDLVVASTDLQLICAPPAIPYDTTSTILMGGKPVLVVRYDLIPPTGTLVAVRFILRG